MRASTIRAAETSLGGELTRNEPQAVRKLLNGLNAPSEASSGPFEMLHERIEELERTESDRSKADLPLFPRLRLLADATPT